MAKTIVYVDGFNLYYGCLKGTPYRWLDVRAFAQKMLPKDQIIGIKYFTARVDARPGHPNARAKQRTYLRALQTLPNLSIFYGRFLTTEITARRVRARVGPRYTQVWKTEEKGSDVNLATELLVDGFQKSYELAVVVSNDGDLKTPIVYVRDKLGLPVGVLNPSKNRSYALSPPKLPRGSFYKPIRAGVLKSSQFPASLADAGGPSPSPPTGDFRASARFALKNALRPPEGGPASLLYAGGICVQATRCVNRILPAIPVSRSGRLLAGISG